MHLKKLHLVGFKNYPQLSLEFSPKLNCFVGDNGEGKTNLLDAIYYLSFTKSYFSATDGQNIRKGEAFFVIEGDFQRDGRDENLYCGFKQNQKKVFKRNKKEYTRLSAHIGQFPTVIISPGDIRLISDSGSERRKYIDTVVSQYDKAYLEKLIHYNRALAQRNSLLKQMAARQDSNYAQLEIWDDRMAGLAAYIYEKRQALINELLPVFRKYYAEISQEKEAVGMHYKSQLDKGELNALLQQQFEKERVLQHTSVGIHRDDVDLRIDGLPLRRAGSQGQQKSFLVALKLAQLEFMGRTHQVHPLLLLDDIFDKLDAHRVAQIMGMVAHHHFGQIFVTDTNKERMQRLLENIQAADYRIFHIHSNQAQEIKV